jgi:hypothetical protein
VKSNKDKHFYFDSDRGREFECHAVPALSGSDSPFYIAQTNVGEEVVVFHEECADDLCCDDLVVRYFRDGKAAVAWFKRSNYMIPSAALRALRTNDLSAPRLWPVLLDDVLRIRRKSFTASWSLSYESDDTGHSGSFTSLQEAYSCLGEEGALMAIPGNSGSIRIGSIRLFSTYFKSNGIDRGDSHVDPTMCSIRTDLFEGISQFERVKAAGEAPARDTLSTSYSAAR